MALKRLRANNRVASRCRLPIIPPAPSIAGRSGEPWGAIKVARASNSCLLELPQRSPTPYLSLLRIPSSHRPGIFLSSIFPPPVLPPFAFFLCSSSILLCFCLSPHTARPPFSLSFLSLSLPLTPERTLGGTRGSKDPASLDWHGALACPGWFKGPGRQVV